MTDASLDALVPLTTSSLSFGGSSNFRRPRPANKDPVPDHRRSEARPVGRNEF